MITLKSTGIVRKVDELGRIVLPIELRRTLDIAEKRLPGDLHGRVVYCAEEISAGLHLLRQREGHYRVPGEEHLPQMFSGDGRTVPQISCLMLRRRRKGSHWALSALNGKSERPGACFEHKNKLWRMVSSSIAFLLRRERVTAPPEADRRRKGGSAPPLR